MLLENDLFPLLGFLLFCTKSTDDNYCLVFLFNAVIYLLFSLFCKNLHLFTSFRVVYFHFSFLHHRHSEIKIWNIQLILKHWQTPTKIYSIRSCYCELGALLRFFIGKPVQTDLMISQYFALINLESSRCNALFLDNKPEMWF